MKQGLIQVYTGDGKGKTTAALGLALRAVGGGLKVAVFQFLKGRKSGELEAASMLNNLEIFPFGSGEFITDEGPAEKDLLFAQKALAGASEAALSGRYDVVILDEINCAVSLGVLSIEEVLPLIDEKPPEVELVLTGRDAPGEIMDRADLITEMKNIKHYYDLGVGPRIGIDL